VIIDTEFYFDTAPFDGRLYDATTTWAVAQEAGVERVVWMPQPGLRPENEAMFRAVETFPQRERFLLCCTLNPQFGQETVAELERCVVDWEMVALKLMPTFHGYALTSPLVRAVMDKARELGVLVNVHSGSFNGQPLQIAALARRYPELTFIMDHMGYRYHVADALTAARECSNIYLSTTLVSPAEPILIKRAVKAVGPERIVFGSNGPGTYVDMALEGIRRLQLGSTAESLIFGANAAQVYGLV
jgi:predicted TIM-barrel fold metal-dependent hydrolase